MGGDFTTVNGQSANTLAVLKADGTMDASFTQNADSTVYAILMQADGKAVIGGSFGRFGGVFHRGLARLHSDGTLESLFTTSIGSYSDVCGFALQTDGKILICGHFSTVNNAARNDVARLESNGMLDAAFDPMQGPNHSVRTMAVQGDSKILLSGDFTTFDAFDHNYVARLNGNPPRVIGIGMTVQIAHAVEILWSFQANSRYRIQWASAIDPNAWYNLGDPVEGNGTTQSVFDENRSLIQKFYRVLKLP